MTRKEQLDKTSRFYVENETDMIPFKQLNYEEPFKIKDKSKFDTIYIKVVYNYGKPDAKFTYKSYNIHFPETHTNYYNLIEDDFLIQPLSHEEFQKWYSKSHHNK